MPTFRNLIPLCAALLASLTVVVPNASADESITVSEEGGDPCNPCAVHLTGETSFTAFHFIPITSCRDELVATINSNGSGAIHDYTNQDNGGPGCTRQNCNGVGEPPTEGEWDFTSEETSANTSEMILQFCLDEKANPDGTGTHCATDVTVTETGTHNYTFNSNYECAAAGIPVRVTSSWTSEEDPTEGQEIELVHQ